MAGDSVEYQVLYQVLCDSTGEVIRNMNFRIFVFHIFDTRASKYECSNGRISFVVNGPILKIQRFRLSRARRRSVLPRVFRPSDFYTNPSVTVPIRAPVPALPAQYWPPAHAGQLPPVVRGALPGVVCVPPVRERPPQRVGTGRGCSVTR